jgi:glycosyltransferase involved in cell wall biosynthesis
MSVTFTGSQTGNELKESYELSKILVVPSTTHPEGQAIVVAEGMAFGLPVIVSDQAVLQEVVGDAGITVPQGNAEALAAAIRKLLSDRNYWKALSERSQERSEYFSMLCFRQSISDLIKDVADYDKSKLAEVRRC